MWAISITRPPTTMLQQANPNPNPNPNPPTLTCCRRRRAAAARGLVHFAHTDLSGLSLFEEAVHCKCTGAAERPPRSRSRCTVGVGVDHIVRQTNYLRNNNKTIKLFQTFTFVIQYLSARLTVIAYARQLYYDGFIREREQATLAAATEQNR